MQLSMPLWHAFSNVIIALQKNHNTCSSQPTLPNCLSAPTTTISYSNFDIPLILNLRDSQRTITELRADDCDKACQEDMASRLATNFVEKIEGSKQTRDTAAMRAKTNASRPFQLRAAYPDSAYGVAVWDFLGEGFMAGGLVTGMWRKDGNPGREDVMRFGSSTGSSIGSSMAQAGRVWKGEFEIREGCWRPNGTLEAWDAEGASVLFGTWMLGFVMGGCGGDGDSASDVLKAGNFSSGDLTSGNVASGNFNFTSSNFAGSNFGNFTSGNFTSSNFTIASSNSTGGDLTRGAFTSGSSTRRRM